MSNWNWGHNINSTKDNTSSSEESLIPEEKPEEDFANINTYRPDLYDKEDIDSWKNALNNNGYVVIKDILDGDSYLKGYDLFKQAWNEVSPRFDFKDKSTWIPDNSPMMWDQGMITWNGLGQSDFQWYLRTNKNIINIFKNLHKTDDLVVSFDGFSVFLTPEQKSRMWLHIDQNPHKPLVKECESIQGAYNFFSVGKDDAGFVVVPVSHKTYVPDKELYRGRQFIQILKDDPHIGKAVKLLVPKNSFILWNSYTLHQNVGMRNLLNELTNIMDTGDDTDYDTDYDTDDNTGDDTGGDTDDDTGDEARDKITDMVSDIVSDKPINRLTSYISYFPKRLRSDIIYRHRLSGYYLSHNCGHYATRHDTKQPPKECYNYDGTVNEYYDLNIINSRLTEDGYIPAERMALI